MNPSVTVHDKIEISAPVEKVWNVLIEPEFIQQWDELPENFGNEALKPGAVIEWEGFSKLTVTAFEPQRLLRLSLFLPNANMDPSEYDIAYCYKLTGKDGKTRLEIEIGDFSPVPEPMKYYDASIEFAQTSKEKIKQLAETR